MSATVAAAFFACNVFTSLDVCSSDAECASGLCDPVGHFCVRPPDGGQPAEGGPDVEQPSTDAGVDVDARVPSCDPSQPFTKISRVVGLETTPAIAARVTSDEETVLFSKLTGCEDIDCYDLWFATRSAGTSFGAFGAPSRVPSINCSASAEFWPTLSADAKLIFFESDRATGSCSSDRARVWSATRVNPATDFDPPRVDSIFGQDAGILDSAPYLHPSGRALYFVSLGRPTTSDAGGGQDIYVADINANGFVTGVRSLDTVNTPDEENFPIISFDDRTLYFSRLQPDDGEPAHATFHDVWVAARSDPTSAFGAPRPITELNTHSDDTAVSVSNDQCRIYFTSNRESTADGGTPFNDYRLWVAERTPQ